jgi:hypothetical protein
MIYLAIGTVSITKDFISISKQNLENTKERIRKKQEERLK